MWATQPHHRDPRFRRLGAQVRAHANATPHTICWRCGRTLHEHPAHHTGRPARWTAGHTIAGQLGPAWLHVTQRPPAGQAWLAPEASTCNIEAGNDARTLNADTGYTWP